MRFHDFSACVLDRVVEAKVAHNGGNKGVLGESPLFHHVQRANGHYTVAVHICSVLIRHEDPVGIAVECHAHMRIVFLCLGAHVVHVHGTAILVDVDPVGLDVQGDYIGSEFGEYAGGNLVNCAVRAVDNDTHAVKGHPPGNRSLHEFDVASDGIIYTKRLADLVGNGADVIDGA